MLAPLIELKRRAEQPWPARAGEGLRGYFAGRSRRTRRRCAGRAGRARWRAAAGLRPGELSHRRPGTPGRGGAAGAGRARRRLSARRACAPRRCGTDRPAAGGAGAAGSAAAGAQVGGGAHPAREQCRGCP
ncbi:MAG: hypothetical protein MZW92_58200, partial [Comamonadaceae bacterium]|nr:hypothetical protein [Comamonadaceae bacterium]